MTLRPGEVDLRLETRDGIRFTDNLVYSDQLPVLLLHGLGNSVFFWESVITRIGDRRRVLAIDIPGFGASDTPANGFTLENVTTEIASFVRTSGIGRVIVAGHSMGAIAALGLSRDHEGLTAGVILIDGHLFSALEALKHPLRAIRKDPALLTAVAAQFIGGLFRLPQPVAGLITSRPWLRRILFRYFVADPDRMDPDRVKAALRDSGGRNVVRTLRLARRTSFDQLSGGGRVALSLIWGELDPLLRPKDLVLARDLFRVVNETELEGIGHWPMLESPDELADLLASYNAPAD